MAVSENSGATSTVEGAWMCSERDVEDSTRKSVENRTKTIKAALIVLRKFRRVLFDETMGVVKSRC